MTINIDAKTWQRYPAQVSGGRFYSDVDKVPVTSLAHGDTYTITGSGFGSAPTVAAFLQSTIEGTAVNSNIAAGGGWTYSTANPFTPSKGYDDATRGRVLKGTYTLANNWNCDTRYDVGSDIPVSTWYYRSWWVRCNLELSSSAYPYGFQWKLGRNNAVNDIADSDCEIALFNHIINAGSDKQVIVRRGGGDNTSYSGGQYPDMNGGWARIELLVYTGTQGNADGKIYQRIYKDGQIYTRTAQEAVEIYNTTARHRFLIEQNFFGNPNNNLGPAPDVCEVFKDDSVVIVDSTRRVELCDNATLSLATHRECQPHTSWESGSIDITVNHGSFAAGQAWLHVVEGLDTSLASVEVTLA